MSNVIPFPQPDVVAGLCATVERRLGAWKMAPDKSASTFRQFEEQLSVLFREALAAALGQALQAADEPSNAVLVEGRVCRRVLTENKTYMTSAGPVSVRRGLFRDRKRGDVRSFAVMEKRLGIIDGFWTPTAAGQALWMVTQMVPQKAAEAMARLGGMTPSKSSLDRLPKSVSKRWEEHRDELERALFETQQIPENTAVLAVAIDGVYAPIAKDDHEESHVAKRRRKHAAGLAARGPDAYREVGCASIAFYDSDTNALGAVRFGRAPEFKKLGVKAMLEAQLRALLDRYPHLEVVFLSDGAPDHWEFFDSLGIEGHQSLDYFHAAEHLNAALGAAYGEGSKKARRRFVELGHILVEEQGGADTVRRSFASLAARKGRSAHAQRILERAVRYFKLHRDRMQYWKLRQLSLPIGSGVMEAACKTLVAQRLKLSGQRWSVHGAQAILTPRGWEQSKRFDEAFALLAALYEQPVATLTPLTGPQLASG